jgi:hypothetical protein
MLVDSTLLGTFRSRFEAKEPDPKNFIRRATKLDFYLTVHDIVEERRTKGFAWGGIAADFTELGVTMSVSTLKTCFRRAREKTQGLHPRTKRPARRGNTMRRGRGDASETPVESAAAAAEPSGIVDDRPAQLASDLSQSSADTAPLQNEEPVVVLDSRAELVAADLPRPSLDSTSLKTVGSREKASFEEQVSNAELGLDEAVHAIAAACDVPTVADAASIGAAGPSSAEPLRPQSSADAGDDAAQARVEEHGGAPPRQAGELAECVGDGRSVMAAPRATSEPPRQNVSRLEGIRARASTSEKRRLAFVPRADDEL